MITTISTVQIILWGLVLAWLGACAACDLRSRQVPGWLTIPPLILAAGEELFQGNWQPVLLLVSLVLISDLPASRWRIPLAGLAAGLMISAFRTWGAIFHRTRDFCGLGDVGAWS